MFTSDTWEFVAHRLSLDFGDLQDDLSEYIAASMMKGSGRMSANEWLASQLSKRQEVAKGVADIIRKRSKDLIRSTDEAYSSMTDTLNEDKINGEVKPIDVKQELNDLARKVAKATESITYGTWYYATANANEPLYMSIYRNLGRVYKATGATYSDGRRVSYKTYIEMRVRTDIQNQATSLLLASGLGKLFRCSSHPDCAPDHADYQGKVYVLDKYKGEYPGYQTVEWVTGAPVYLTTRPNCRHILTPINGPDDDAQPECRMGDTKRMYANLQRQRELERDIRKAKTSANSLKAMLDEAPMGSPRQAEAKRLWQNALSVVKRNQGENAELIKANPYLKRNYRREDETKLAYDLGVDLHTTSD